MFTWGYQKGEGNSGQRVWAAVLTAPWRAAGPFYPVWQRPVPAVSVCLNSFTISKDWERALNHPGLPSNGAHYLSAGQPRTEPSPLPDSVHLFLTLCRTLHVAAALNTPSLVNTTNAFTHLPWVMIRSQIRSAQQVFFPMKPHRVALTIFPIS